VVRGDVPHADGDEVQIMIEGELVEKPEQEQEQAQAAGTTGTTGTTGA